MPADATFTPASTGLVDPPNALVVAPAATATPVVQETSQEISPFSPGTTGNMFDVPTSGMSL